MSVVCEIFGSPAMRRAAACFALLLALELAASMRVQEGSKWAPGPFLASNRRSSNNRPAARTHQLITHLTASALANLQTVLEYYASRGSSPPASSLQWVIFPDGSQTGHPTWHLIALQEKIYMFVGARVGNVVFVPDSS